MKRRQRPRKPNVDGSREAPNRSQREVGGATKARNAADATTFYFFAASSDASFQTSGGPTFAACDKERTRADQTARRKKNP